MSKLVVTLVALVTVQVCLAALPAEYQSKTAKAKQEILWSKISAKPYKPSELPMNGLGLWDAAHVVVAPYHTPTFTHVSDELPEGRTKVFHPYGSSAKINFNVYPNSTFTGIFKSGGCGIARWSIAAKDAKNFIPGLAVKILVDGKPSYNIISMYSLDGQGADKNGFKNSFTTVINDPKSLAIAAVAKVLELALLLLPGSKESRPEGAGNLPQYEAASFESNGKAVTGHITAPYKLTFIPNPKVGWASDSTDDFRVHLASILPKTLIYYVAVRKTAGGPDELIGEVVTDGPFIASQYNDEGLFMQHPSTPWKA